MEFLRKWSGRNGTGEWSDVCKKVFASIWKIIHNSSRKFNWIRVGRRRRAGANICRVQSAAVEDSDGWWKGWKKCEMSCYKLPNFVLHPNELLSLFLSSKLLLLPFFFSSSQHLLSGNSNLFAFASEKFPYAKCLVPYGTTSLPWCFTFPSRKQF